MAPTEVELTSVTKDKFELVDQVIDVDGIDIKSTMGKEKVRLDNFESVTRDEDLDKNVTHVKDLLEHQKSFELSRISECSNEVTTSLIGPRKMRVLAELPDDSAEKGDRKMRASRSGSSAGNSQTSTDRSVKGPAM